MLDERLVYVAAVLNLTGSGSYVIATLRGRTRPNRVSWFIWALAPLVAFGAELDEGVGIHSLMTFIVGFGPALVLVVSLRNRHASWRITRLDLTCGVLALIAIGTWFGAGRGTVAIALAIAADTLAALPTLVKSYRHPRTESSWVFWLGAVSAAITLLTIDRWDLPHAGFPIYILVMGALIGWLVTFRVDGRGALAVPAQVAR